MIKCPSGLVTSQRLCDPIEKPLQALEEWRLSVGAALRSGVLKPLGKYPTPCRICTCCSGRMTKNARSRCENLSGLVELFCLADASPKS
ncbi:hypothetical protein F2Q68_00037110 [Brassica cretica]|uniref:Uncharacterized protein n=2 Tax=Brassica cretica TaxID=69181 RepID=A0ABQ7EFZ8_BRACR|nr:hypothetical protein F2Q68_00037110 [Brassica cretica]KAF3595736.1 hypothetical protein DY000_02026809 [Brassica cretica]